MGKLIDADDVMNVYKKLPNIPKIEKDMLYSILEDIPTAYNVDKVVQQLESVNMEYDCKNCIFNDSSDKCIHDCDEGVRAKFIEIVKAGGKE